MSKKKASYYVVWSGDTATIYDSWVACEAHVKGTAGVKFKGFATLAEAEQASREPAEKYIVRKPKETDAPRPTAKGPVLPALAVDAACSGNPGVMEFRGVIADTGTEVFHRGPFVEGTNNIGEFLALVLGLAYIQTHRLNWVIYTDSVTALAWVRAKRCKSQIEWNASNQDLFLMVRKAEMWLHDNTWITPIYKWNTKAWGEIPADFGRK